VVGQKMNLYISAKK